MIKKVIFILALVLPIQIQAFSDIPAHYPFEEAINYGQENNIIQGYSDNTYKPRKELNRAELTKIIIESKINHNPIEYSETCFPDVSVDDWFSSYVCYALENGIVNGKPDGKFYPNEKVKISEAAKIIVNTLELEPQTSDYQKWFSEYLETLTLSKFLPNTFANASQTVTRGEIIEMIWRIKLNITNKDSASNSQIHDNPCEPLQRNIPYNIDINKVRNEWLSWNNQIRTDLGLAEYSLDGDLNRTATDWSQLAAELGYIDHKRYSGAPYYDYNGILNWFKGKGVNFSNINGATYSENIGWNTFSCSEQNEDCTQELINRIKTTYDFFYSEKGQSYAPHYNSMVKPEFQKIGVGIAVTGTKYYLTIHYGTDAIPTKLRTCSTIDR